MDNIASKRNNHHTGQRGEVKRLKKTRYNDSLGKYKTKYQNLIHKQKNEANQNINQNKNINTSTNQNKFEEALTNLKSGLVESSQDIEIKEKKQEYKPIRRHNFTNTQRSSLSVPKYHILRPTTPKRVFNLAKRKIYINTPKTMNDSSYFKTAENFVVYPEVDRNNRYVETLRPKYRNYSRPSFRPLLTSTDFGINMKSNINNFIDNTRGKELITLNNILTKQNKELRQKAREMRYKINDLLNNIKLIRMDNQKNNDEKKKLLMEIKNLENQLDYNKNMSLNELELKSNTITKLNEELMHLNALVDEKENEILNLNEKINMSVNNNNNNNKYRSMKQHRNVYNNNNNNNNEIKELEYNLNEDIINNDINNQELSNMNNNELINIINNLKEEINNLRFEKENNEQKNKMMNNNLIDNKNKLIANDEKINNLLQENQNVKKKYQKLKNEYEKMKNYVSHNQSQRVSFGKLQTEYENKLNELTQQCNELHNENNMLKNAINNSGGNNQQNQNINDENMDNQLLIQIKYLNEENNMLKEQLNQQKVNNNYMDAQELNPDDNEQINYLKNKIDDKNNEINKYKDQLQNLVNQLNEYKNNTENLSNENNYLQQEKEEMNRTISELKNENQKKLRTIANLQNKVNSLSLDIENANSGLKNNSYNNNQNQNNQDLEQQILLLNEKNEELQEQLNNLNNNNNNNFVNNNNDMNQIMKEKKELIAKNNELKNELISLQNNIHELEEENHKNILQISRNNELENQLKETKKECEIYLTELKIKENENQKLLNMIKNNENEKVEGEGDDNNIEEINQFNIRLNEDIEVYKTQLEEKNAQIEKLENEVNNYKTINNKILQDNTQLKENIQLIKSGQDEGLIITIDNLKEELKDKNLQIQKLIEDNNILRNKSNRSKSNRNSHVNNIKINNDDDEEKEIDLNKHDFNPFRQTVNSTGLTDADKVKLYKDQIKEYKLINESDKIQIKTLKEDIKMLKSKVKNLETFGGKMKDLNEFISVFNQALLNYKPKKAEQKDALNRIIDALNNSHN